MSNCDVVWSGVRYQRQPFVFKPTNNIYTKSTRVPHSLRTKSINKAFITTKCSYQSHSVFHLKSIDKSPINSKINLSLNREKSYSISSFSSYGLMVYDDKISAKLSNTARKSAMILTPASPLTHYNEVNKVILEDLLDRPSAADLLEGFIREKILKRKAQPIKNTQYNIKHMYDNCIGKSKILNKFLLKDVSFLPDYLKDLIRKSIAFSSSTAMKAAENHFSDNFFQAGLAEKDTFRVVTQEGEREYVPKKDVINSLNMDNNEFRRFFNPLLLAKTFFISVDTDIVELIGDEKIGLFIDNLTKKLVYEADKPDGESRKLVLTALKSVKFNLPLLRALSLQVDYWYDGLLNGLFSKYRTVVEDTCMVIAFICFQPILAQTIINNTSFDVSKDTVGAILRAMELKPFWYNIYSFALGLVIGCCQRFSILEVIYEKVHISRQYVVLANWPHFIFYATQFWRTQNLTAKYIVILKIIHYLEFCMLKNLSRGPAKRAIVYFSQRCSVNCKSLTIWPGKRKDV